MIIITGMAGGASIPKPISHQELLAWAILSQVNLQPWEARTLRAMDNAWLAEHNGQGHGKKHQAIGDYCQGVEVEKCRSVFGDQLERVCSTCPS